ncbi:hypothetical protein [Streptosporangium longisporum]|uniref:Uncharacterized protein n=1 Tax=Streptosporangium longisporum TaxID=46187 RepID=A0ABP6LGW9_9ACTN
MRLTIDVHRTAGGHLAGTVQDEAERPLPFHGVIELVTLLENHLDG